MDQGCRLTSVLHSVAAIDLLTMGIFFQVLKAIQAITRTMKKKINQTTTGSFSLFLSLSFFFSLHLSLSLTHKANETAVVHTPPVTLSFIVFFRLIKIIIGSLLVTSTATTLQRFFNLKGSSVSLSVLLAYLLKTLKPDSGSIRQELDSLSSLASTIFLCLFYAAIGLSSGAAQLSLIGLPVATAITVILVVRELIVLSFYLYTLISLSLSLYLSSSPFSVPPVRCSAGA